MQLTKSFPHIADLKNREFAYLTWDKNYMIRHEGYDDENQFFNRIKTLIPRNVYASAALYEMPNAKRMEEKKWIGCDFVMDIDADHFDLECQQSHDYTFCSNCLNLFIGTPPKECPKCGSKKWKKQPWLCDKCLNATKMEVYKILDFFTQDFGISEDEIFVKFSGHRGYHLEIHSERVRNLDSEARRQITDYLTGSNLILNYRKNNFDAPTQSQYGWREKISKKFYEILKYKDISIFKNSKDPKIEPHLISLLFKDENRKYLLNQIATKNSNWSIKGIGPEGWKKIIQVVINQIKCEVDIPVSIDIHRLLRVKGSINGKTGFLVKPLSIAHELENFDPLSDSILFDLGKDSKKNMKIKITRPAVPEIKIAGNIYGPYKQGEELEVPEAVGVFFICKDTAVVV
ncbi:MAG: DNA primase small subunit domain-containing protein [Promethearchaeota archaeon]